MTNPATTVTRVAAFIFGLSDIRHLVIPELLVCLCITWFGGCATFGKIAPPALPPHDSVKSIRVYCHSREESVELTDPAIIRDFLLVLGAHSSDWKKHNGTPIHGGIGVVINRSDLNTELVLWIQGNSVFCRSEPGGPAPFCALTLSRSELERLTQLLSLQSRDTEILTGRQGGP